MPHARRGEVWRVDLGITAKTRPCLVLTDPPTDAALDLYTVVPHTTALRDNPWEVQIPKNFLQHPGAFHVQQIQSVSRRRLEQKLGQLTKEELSLIEARIHQLFGWS
jgi:mRNA interferase MazF